MLMAFQVLTTVFRKPGAIALAAAVSIIAFLLATWLPNLGLIIDVFGSPDVATSEKIGLLRGLTGSIATNFDLFSASYTIALAVLFGIYIALFTHLLRNRIRQIRKKSVASGVLGIGIGTLGVGCAACGSFLVPGLLSLLGAGGAMALLPLGGSEFGIAGVILLLIAVAALVRQIGNPAMCRIKKQA